MSDSPVSAKPKAVATRGDSFVYDQSPGFWRVYDRASNDSVSVWKKTKVLMDGKQHDFDISAEDAIELAEGQDIPLQIGGKDCFVFNAGVKLDEYTDKTGVKRQGTTIMPATGYPRMINGKMCGYQIWQKTPEGNRCVNIRNNLGESTVITAAVAFQLINNGESAFAGKQLMLHGIVAKPYTDKEGKEKTAYDARAFVVGERNRHDSEEESAGEEQEASPPRRTGPRI